VRNLDGRLLGLTAGLAFVLVFVFGWVEIRKLRAAPIVLQPGEVIICKTFSPDVHTSYKGTYRSSGVVWKQDRLHAFVCFEPQPR